MAHLAVDGALAEHKLVLLTGEAGTGKTTLLGKLARHWKDEGRAAAVCYCSATRSASAALRDALELDDTARCGTVHSEFAIPVDAYNGVSLEWDWAQFVAQRRLEPPRRRDPPDVVVIDEVSMVPAHLLVAVDITLRQWRAGGAGQRFGGASVLLVGDFLQLQPPSGCSALESSVLAGFHTVLLTRQMRVVDGADQAGLLELQRAVRMGPAHDGLSPAAAAMRDRLLCACADGSGAGCGPAGAAARLHLFATRAEADAENDRHRPDAPAKVARFRPTVSGVAKCESLLDDLVGKGRRAQEYWRDQRVAFTATSKAHARSGKSLYVPNGTTGTVTNVRARFATDEAGAAGWPRLRDVDAENGPCDFGAEDEFEVAVRLDRGEEVWVPVAETQRRLCDELHEHTLAGCYALLRHVPLASAWAVTRHRAQGITADGGTLVCAHFEAREAEDVRSRVRRGQEPPGFCCGGLYVALTRVRHAESLRLCGAGWHFTPAGYCPLPASCAVRWWLALMRAAVPDEQTGVALVPPIAQQALPPGARLPRAGWLPRDPVAFAERVLRFCYVPDHPEHWTPPVKRPHLCPDDNRSKEDIAQHRSAARVAVLRALAHEAPHLAWGFGLRPE